MRQVFYFMVGFLLAQGLVYCANKAHADVGTSMTLDGTPVINALDFKRWCQSEPKICDTQSSARKIITLDVDSYMILKKVNNLVNKEVVQTDDMVLYGVEDYWTLPKLINGRLHGDCEDMVILKKKLLLEYGIPSGAMLLTNVWTKEGVGHLVLTVVTDQGDVILDSLTNVMNFYKYTTHSYYSRQSQFNSYAWVKIVKPSPSGM